MTKIKHFFGMAWTSPIIRTGVQAAAVVLAGAGMGWVDPDVWKLAGLAAGAAVFAKLQAVSRG